MDRVRKIGESDPALMNAILEMAASKVAMHKSSMFGIRGRAASFLNSFGNAGLNNGVKGIFNPVHLFPSSNMNFNPQMCRNSPQIIYNNCTFNITSNSAAAPQIQRNSEGFPPSRFKKRRRVVEELVEEK